MATEMDNVASDTEASEKPVREQLKKASIGGSESNMAHEADVTEGEAQELKGIENGDKSELAAPSSLHRKRSYEEFGAETQPDDETANPPTGRHHTRKRSRDSSAEENELNNGQRKSGERSRDDAEVEVSTASNGAPTAPVSEQRPRTPEQTGDKREGAAVEEITSPKSKRSRLHSEPSEENWTANSIAVQETSTGTAHSSSSSDPASDEKESVSKIPPTSAFANTSTSSPFASLAGSKSPSTEPAQTSSSTFAASGFGSLSGAATSGFGAIGKSSGGFGMGGGFGTGSQSPPPATVPKADEKHAAEEKNTFGGALGSQSPFATSGSGGGFGGFGKAGQSSVFGSSGTRGGFGGLGGLGGGGLTSFTSGKPSSGLSGLSKPPRAFGTPADEDEERVEDDEEEHDESGFRSPLSQESDKQDDRFYEQDLETGEEDEKTEYSCRAKLYNFVSTADGKKEWKEKGLGVVRLNVKKFSAAVDDGEEDNPTAESSGPKARLLMRADGSHRVILNTPVKKEIKFGSPEGGPPQGTYVYFMGALDGTQGLELMQLKIRQQFAVELCERIVELQEQM